MNSIYLYKQLYNVSSYLLIVAIYLVQVYKVFSQTCGKTIPSTATSIAANAYAGCESLTSVTVPSTVTYIGKGLILH